MASPQAQLPPTDLEGLKRENAKLREELTRIKDAEARSSARRQKALKTAGSFLLPMFDRQRVVRSFMELVETTADFTGPREKWPTREDVVEKSKLFALAFMRFVVRRRMLMFMFSLLAFTVPGLQLYVAIKQNEIIENQNKYFNIQVYDIVARSITSGDMTGKQITTALLAREDFQLLNGIIYQVFSTEAAGAFTAAEATQVQPLLLREAAARGHLIAALVQAIDTQARKTDVDELWRAVDPTMAFVLQDASFRVPQLLRIGDEGASADPGITQETHRYLFNVGSLLRKAWSLSVSAGEEEAFFARLSPFVLAVSQARTRPLGGTPFATVFSSAIQELIVDLALAPKLGQATETTSDPQRIQQLLQEGLKRLRGALQGNTQINWDNFRRVIELP
jgi:hypothetical protein